MTQRYVIRRRDRAPKFLIVDLMTDRVTHKFFYPEYAEAALPLLPRFPGDSLLIRWCRWCRRKSTRT